MVLRPYDVARYRAPSRIRPEARPLRSPSRRIGPLLQRSWALLLVLALASGCATRIATVPARTPATSAGYRFDAGSTTPDNTNALFVVLCFSGGGARAMALAYGVLEEVARTRVRRPDGRGAVRRLDEVDILSGVSGGAFLAAYYAAFGEATLRTFRSQCLDGDLEGDGGQAALQHWNLGRLASPTFDRVDLAAEVFDRRLFAGRTFGDARRRAPRPTSCWARPTSPPARRSPSRKPSSTCWAPTWTRTRWPARWRPRRPFPASSAPSR